MFVDSVGEVGIGTTNPLRPLHINGTNSALVQLSTTSIACYQAFENTNSTATNAVQIGAVGVDEFAVLTGNTGEKLRITSDGKVGVGTSSPATPLHISTSDETVATLLNTTNAAGTKTLLRFSQNTNLDNVSGTIGIKRAALNAGVGFEVNLANSGGTLQNRLTILESGEVGIGTTSPLGKTHIQSNSTGLAAVNGAGDELVIENTGSAGMTIVGTSQSNIYFADADDADIGGIQYSHTDDALFFRVNNAERARIDSSGRLLIGTSTSVSQNVGNGTITSQIQLAGLNQSTSSLSLVNYFSGGSPANLILGSSTGGTVGTQGVVANNGDLGRIAFIGSDGSGLIEAAQILAEVDGTPGADDMPGRLVFSTTADASASPTEAMRINSTQELLVGYTSDNGAYKLQVNSQIFATSATIATSDGRYKDNVTTLDGCADLIRSLRPVSFDWKPQQNITRLDEDGNETLVREGHNFPAGTQVGFIAQEVQDVLTGKPWLGSIIKENVRPAITDADGTELAPEEQFYGIAEGNLIAVLTSALKDTLSEIDALKARVAALEAP